MADTETPKTAVDPADSPAEVRGPLAVVDGGDDESYPSCFQCCVCLDLLYKPVVLACGHISCFWCVHKAMHNLKASHCALCRQPYIHFPGICQLLHHLLLKLEPVTYKRREHEILEEEKLLDVFSPQFGDPGINDGTSGAPEEIIRSHPAEIERSQAVKFPSLSENDLENGKDKQLSVDDLLCVVCKKLLFLPAVLNCGHVFCDSCMCGLANNPLKCPVCKGLHPGEFPNVCLDLDHFLQEQFPKEYAVRRQEASHKRAERQHGESSYSAVKERRKGEPQSKNDPLLLDEDWRNLHVGVGCDSCGMFPMVGKRYRCKDCKEAIGFDLCETCYNGSLRLPGRFNQQHTPDHTFEIDDSHMLSNILLRSFVTDDPHQHPIIYLPGDLPEDHDDPDRNSAIE